MPVQLYSNNVNSTLAAQLLVGGASLTVASGQGARFPSPTAGDWFLATLFGYSGQTEINHEIVKVTARTGDVLTITRAQEGTTARQWEIAAPIEMRMTAGSFPVVSVAGKLGAVTLVGTDISNTPSGNLAAVTVQAALNELQSDIDTRATSASLSSHTGATTGAHGMTAFGASLVDDADATAGRTTLGLANSATITASTANTASTLAQRDASGYINAVIFNMSFPADNIGATNYCYEAADGYIRKKTVANVKAELVTSAAVISALGYTPWHAGNDGSGTGLDADTLDGNDSAAFLLKSGGTMTGDVAWGNHDQTGAKTIAFNGEYNCGNSGTGTTTIDFGANGQKQKITLTGSCTISVSGSGFPGVGHYQLRLIQDGTGGRAVTWAGGMSSSRWLGSASAPAINTAINGETIVNFFYDGTNIVQSASKVGAV